MAMMTVKEVSGLTGVSIRTLQYYDKIGLLAPADYTESGYRLYDDTALERLQQTCSSLLFLPAAFCTDSSYAAVLPHCSFACFAYASIFRLSNAEKSILRTIRRCGVDKEI